MRIILILLCLLVVTGCNQQEPAATAVASKSAPDYMTPELRAKIEVLKADVKQAATDQSTAADRSKVVFEWINAYAKSGRTVPVEATSVVAQINA